jgi:AcrR family transcriptional regulator
MVRGLNIKKSDETPKKIIEAFLRFYAEKPFDRITIKSITEFLKINRGTFYLHYFDLDDLLTSIEDEHLQAISRINDKYRHYYLSKNLNELKKFYIPTLQYIEAHKYVIGILMNPHSRLRFREEFKTLMRSNVRYKWDRGLHSCEWDEFKQHIIEVLITVNVDVISKWVCTENDNSFQKVANFFCDTLLNLPYANLR